MVDDELYRRVKARAATEGRTVTELIEAGLRAALDAPAPADAEVARRVRLPLISATSGNPGLFAGMSQEEIHERLARLQLEDDRAHAALPP